MAKSTGRRLFEMLSNGYMTDVTFVVQGTEIEGHRVVASSQGGVLKNLLKEETTTVMIDKEISPKTFGTVLEFLYTDDCKVNFDNISMLIDAAKILQLKSLEDHCAHAKQNVGKALLKQTNDVEGYSKVCQRYFRTNSSKIIESKEYLEFSRDVFVVFCSNYMDLNCDTHSVLELFLACVEWAKKECKRLNLLIDCPENLRSVVSDALSKIDFTRIVKEDFLELVVPMRILTSEEVGEVVMEWWKWNRAHNKAPEITVEVRFRRYGVCNLSKLCVPSTRISELKEKCIFNGGKKFAPDTFTLGRYGKELHDDMTVASIYTPGEDLNLDVHSVNFVVNIGSRKFPVPVKTDDLGPECETHIKRHFYGRKIDFDSYINPEYISIPNLGTADPGSVIKFRISMYCWIMILLYTMIIFWGIFELCSESLHLEEHCCERNGVCYLLFGFGLMLKWLVIVDNMCHYKLL